MQWTFAIGEKSKLRRELDRMGRFVGAADIRFGWLGGWVMVGAGNAPALWDLAVLADLVPRAGGRQKVGNRQEIAILNRVPLYVGAHIRNPIALVATLTAIRGFAESAAPGMVAWLDGPIHRKVKTVTVEVRLRDRGAPEPFTIHYAIAGSAIIASLDEATLLSQIDAVLDDRAPREADHNAPDTLQSHINFASQHPTSWLTRTALALVETEALRQKTGAFRDMEILTKGLRQGIPSRATALAYLGYEPSAVQGGAFQLRDRRLHHTLYGAEFEPAVPRVPLKNAPATRLLESLETLRMGIAFEGEGRSRGLHIKLGWTRR